MPAFSRTTLKQALCLAAIMASLKLALHIGTNLWQTHLGYGLHRDELYYLICGRRLAWGYVDHAPVVALQARLAELLFGTSVTGVRLFSSLAGSSRVFLTGILCWQLGGGRRAQFLSMLGVLAAPLFLGLDSFLSMNSVDPVFWLTFLITLIALSRGARPQLWLLAGALTGLGILNKPSMFFFVVAMLAGLLLSPARSAFRTRYFPLGATLAAVLVAPYILWQIRNHWPTPLFMHQQLAYKVAPFNLFAFMQAPEWNFMPITLPLWVGGLFWLLHDHQRRNTRWLGYAFLLFFFLMAALHSKDYYLASVFCLLFAAGGILWENLLALPLLRRWGPVLLSLYSLAILAFSSKLLPASIPVLSPADWPRYLAATHQEVTPIENFANGPLPQFFADRFGWPELAAQVRHIVATLPPADRADLGILCDNYGEASAINFYNTRDQSPLAVSGHNNYFLWGPNNYTGDLLLLVTDKSPAELAQTYASVQPIGKMNHPLSMPHEHKTIYLVRHRIRPLTEDWPTYRWYF